MTEHKSDHGPWRGLQSWRCPQCGCLAERAECGCVDDIREICVVVMPRAVSGMALRASEKPLAK